MEAAAIVEIGLSRAEFWDLTARQYQRFFDRYIDREIRHERSFHQLTRLFAVANITHPTGGQWTLEDFAPALRGSAVARAQEFQPVESQIAMLKIAHALRGGANKPVGTWGRLTDEEFAALFPDRERIH